MLAARLELGSEDPDRMQEQPKPTGLKSKKGISKVRINQLHHKTSCNSL